MEGVEQQRPPGRSPRSYLPTNPSGPGSHRDGREAEKALRPGHHPLAEETLAHAPEHDLCHHQGGQVVGLPAIHVHGEGAENSHQEVHLNPQFNRKIG